jgi:hypothetical protein
MSGNKTGKQSKNNPDGREKLKQPKIISSADCQKCNEKCDAYFKYEKSLLEGKVGKGVICRKGL